MYGSRYSKRRYTKRYTRKYKSRRSKSGSGYGKYSRGLSRTGYASTVSVSTQEFVSGSASDNSNPAIFGNGCRGSLGFNMNSGTVNQGFCQQYMWYRVKKVDVWITCSTNQNPVINGTEPTGGVNAIYYDPLIHYDMQSSFMGAVYPSISSMAESTTYGNILASKSGLFRRTIYPKYMLQMNEPPQTTVPAAAPTFIGWAQADRKTWISTQNSGSLVAVPLMRFYVDPIANATTPSGAAISFAAPGVPLTIKVWMRATVEFKGQGNP